MSKEELDERGVMPRAFEYLFYKLKDNISNPDYLEFSYQVHCSYLEIYNEKIMDLLDATSSIL